MRTVISRDGTRIAFDETGQGRAVILVVGAFNDRSTGRPLAQHLEQHFTVFNYDRRGRGDSSDTAPYSIEREIEDIQALIDEAGGSAYVFGYSSGAVLALRAAAQGLAIIKMALYELPLLVGGGHSRQSVDHPENLNELIESGRRGDAVEYYQRKVIGIPEDIVAQLRQAPFRPALEAIAHTLVYEATILGDMSLPKELAAAVTMPTLAIAGGASFPFMRETAQVLANILPAGRSRTLEGQTHDIVPAVLAPVLEQFFGGSDEL
jgi:pimeloyl-ACP methyl ester carboxylesterase